MKRYCLRMHVMDSSDCVSYSLYGLHFPGLHCPECGLLTQKVGDLYALPPRLLRVLPELATGQSSKEIAARLGLSQGTLKVYISQLFTATGTSNRVMLALFWLRMQEADGAVASLRSLGVVA